MRRGRRLLLLYVCRDSVASNEGHRWCTLRETMLWYEIVDMPQERISERKRGHTRDEENEKREAKKQREMEEKRRGESKERVKE